MAIPNYIKGLGVHPLSHPIHVHDGTKDVESTTDGPGTKLGVLTNVSVVTKRNKKTKKNLRVYSQVSEGKC